MLRPLWTYCNSPFAVWFWITPLEGAETNSHPNTYLSDSSSPTSLALIPLSFGSAFAVPSWSSRTKVPPSFTVYVSLLPAGQSFVWVILIVTVNGPALLQPSPSFKVYWKESVTAAPPSWTYLNVPSVQIAGVPNPTFVGHVKTPWLGPPPERAAVNVLSFESTSESAAPADLAPPTVPRMTPPPAPALVFISKVCPSLTSYVSAVPTGQSFCGLTFKSTRTSTWQVPSVKIYSKKSSTPAPGSSPLWVYLKVPSEHIEGAAPRLGSPPFSQTIVPFVGAVLIPLLLIPADAIVNGVPLGSVSAAPPVLLPPTVPRMTPPPAPAAVLMLINWPSFTLYVSACPVGQAFTEIVTWLTFTWHSPSFKT